MAKIKKVIVYQGYEEKFRVRVTQDDKVVLNTELFDTQEEAIEFAEALGKSYGAKVEVRETIQDVAKALAEKNQAAKAAAKRGDE